jgi:S-adenosyl-L-methionine hydrolase (adenosine-forming)
LTKRFIALTTDFGWGSSYVAQLKGVIASLAPNAGIIDVAHDLPSFSLRHAEVLLRSTAFAFPVGTVHVVVVDPGVGTARRPLAVKAAGMHFVGPDNGILGGPLAQTGAQCVVLDKPELFMANVSHTFHGRDIFAPVACELAQGMPLQEVGSPINDPLPSTLPAATRADGAVRGETLCADRYGNLTTNIPARWCAPDAALLVDGRLLRRVRTYGEAQPGDSVSLTGSDGFMEVAVREGSAWERFGQRAGHAVQVAVQ